jgi:long-chain acyl-CoA synthetase
VSTRTIGEDLRAAAAAEPDKVAVVTSDGALTYGELDFAAERVARGLWSGGVERGDRVALLLANGLEAVVSIYGVLRAGAALSPLHPSVKRDKLAYVLAHSGARLLITDADRAEVGRAGAGDAGGVEVCDDVRGLDGPGRSGNPPLSVDLAGIIYTSGSTGEPKGVTVNHANMTFVADSIIEYLEMSEDERVLSVLPLSFGYGLYQLLTCVRSRATLVLEPGFGLAGRIVELLERERITALPGVPTVFAVLLSLRSLGERHLPALRTLTNAGAPLPSATAEALRKTFPAVRIFCMYGQTEAQRVCYLPPDELAARPGSVGIPIPGTEAWIEDERGEVAAPGAVGELIVRGAHVMQGYWADPQATSERLRPGRWSWERVLATGDLFRSDDDAYLYFVSRTDDIIKCRGEKVVPREIEEVLHAASEVHEAAVVGVPDSLLGEAVIAHVSPEPGKEVDAQALRRRCAEQLEDYMVPKRVVIHDALPRTPNGKLDRRALTDHGPEG